MKKLSLYIFLMFLGFTACTEDYNDNIAPPQTNPEEPAVNIDFQIANAESSNFDINNIESDSVVVLKESSLPVYSETATVKYELQISADESFKSKGIMTAVLADKTYKVDIKELDESVIALFGRTPESRALKARLVSYVSDNGQTLSAASNTVAMNITPKAPVIESAYYLIGDVNEWKFANLDAYKFSHSGNDVYEDPVFSIIVEMGGYFKIAPQSAKDAGLANPDYDWADVIGNPIDGNTELSGELIVANGQAMRVEESQWVRVTLNMLEGTYTIDLLGTAKRFLYVPGAHQNWTPSTAPLVYSQNLDLQYDGYVYMNADNVFKFTSEPNWDGINYGNGGGDVLSIDNGAGNLSVAETGLYRLTVNLSSEPYTYSATKTEWGLIGDATAGGWDASTPMVLNEATTEWTVTTTLTGGATFKFRANNGWDINLGGDTNNLTYDGDNIAVAESGTYTVTLKLGDSSAYTCTVVKN